MLQYELKHDKTKIKQIINDKILEVKSYLFKVNNLKYYQASIPNA